jgi:hypothetical protein
MNAMELITNRIMSHVKEGMNILELGCGLEAPWQYGIQKRANLFTMIDAYAPYLANNLTHGDNVIKICGVAPEILTVINNQDLVLIIDVMEHLTEDDSIATLLRLFEIGKKILLLTPNGHYPQEKDNYLMGADYWQQHKREWNEKELMDMGFNVEVWGGFHPLGSALWGVWEQ